MSIHPGYSGQEFMPEALDRIGACARALARAVHVQVDGGIGEENIRRRLRRGRDAASSPARRSSIARICRAPIAGWSRRWREPLERALELAERGRGKVRDHPLVGAVVVAGDEVVGEGWYEYDGRSRTRRRSRSSRPASARAARRST